ncbi:FtsX-like permease family protein, partial [bacterium]|nr:FtsX-like permease family protein [bacterium]
QTVDAGQIWLPLAELQRLTNMPNEATLVIVKSGLQPPAVDDIPAGWNFRDLDFLLKDLHEMIKSKTIGGSIFYAVLMILAMLAIFDTQVFSIFRRRKEMGTMMALGMTRRQLIGLFTLEGAMHGVLAMLLSMLYGGPLLIAFSRSGMTLPDTYDSYGIALGDTLYPVYTVGLVIGTILLVLLTTTIVSYLPTRKIAKLKPNEALRGNLT